MPDSSQPYNHRCMVCDAHMRYLFSKTFNSWGLSTLDYERCVACGFVACATLLEMPSGDWEHLNEWFHSTIYDTDDDPYDRTGRLNGQAIAIDRLAACGLIPQSRPMLDWGSGVGDLAEKLLERGLTLFSYDQFITPQINPLPTATPAPRSYSLVTATAVFEHLTRREQLDAIEGLVANDGVLGIHLVIPREIPVDPEWVYLLPVHCAFHTWESIRRLMIHWGYAASAYCQVARMWFFFKSSEGVQEKVDFINALEGPEYLIYSEGFVSSNGVHLPLDPGYGTVDSTSKGLYIGCKPCHLPSNWAAILFEPGEFLSPADLLSSVQDLTFDFVYSDMVAERMATGQFEEYLRAVGELIRPGGLHRIATTDLQRVLANAQSGAWSEFRWVKKARLQTPADYLNTVFRSWGHKHLYDAESVIHRLEQSGYRDVSRVEMMKGGSADLFRLDQEKSRLYVEATR